MDLLKLIWWFFVFVLTRNPAVGGIICVRLMTWVRRDEHSVRTVCVFYTLATQVLYGFDAKKTAEIMDDLKPPSEWDQ